MYYRLNDPIPPIQFVKVPFAVAVGPPPND